jgi:hypothetical protein
MGVQRASLDPQNSSNSFDIYSLCSLVSKFYASGLKNKKDIFEMSIALYEHDILTRPKFQNLTTISDLCL